MIRELRKVWEGVDGYSKENFELRAALMWTINYSSAYANLFDWSTKGCVASLVCMNSTHSIWLKHSRKFSYMGWLQHNHPYKFQKDLFDGTIEKGIAPSLLSMIDFLRKLEGTHFTYGRTSKSSRKRARDDGASCNKVVSTRGVDDSTSYNAVYRALKMLMVLLRRTLMGINNYGRKEASSLIFPMGNTIFGVII